VKQEGQSLVEFSLILPLLLVVALGVVEASYALLDQHIVSKISREGSNLISRDVTLLDAVTAMKTMQTRPVNFDSGSKLILSVIKKGATTGTTNYDRHILYQRYEYGTLAAASRLTTQGTGSFGGAPDYVALNSDTNAALQLTNLPGNIDVVRGGLLYVAEVYTAHETITPLDRFGIAFPDTLYSIAFF
jgi:Flp pilus assembly protein TadG